MISVAVEDRFGVVWSRGDGEPRVGELSLGPGYLAIDTPTRSGPGAWIAAEQVASMRHAEPAEQLRSIQTLVVDSAVGRVAIAPFEEEQRTRLEGALTAFAASPSPTRPLRLVIAGAGVAGLEAALAVRERAGARVTVTILSAQPYFTYRPLLVMEPFGEPAPRYSLERIAAEQGATLEIGTVASIDTTRCLLLTESEAELRYDVLLVTLGARTRPAVAGALTFGGATTRAVAAIVDRVETRQEHLTLVVPKGVFWTLPLYELALLTSRRVPASSAGAITVVTSEHEPLGVLGADASETVTQLLTERNVRILTNREALRVEGDTLVIAPSEKLRTDHVIALPHLEGPWLHGLPHDRDGYLPTDRFAHVAGLSTVLAAGDATTFPIKQGGIGAQQAEVAAGVIAARAAMNAMPDPFDPVIEAHFMTGGEPIYTRTRLEIGVGTASVVSALPFVPRLHKMPGGRLSRYLASCQTAASCRTRGRCSG